MDIEKAKRTLESLGIPRQWYSFEYVDSYDDVSILVKDGAVWKEYGLTRGTLKLAGVFHSESDACIYLIEELYSAHHSDTEWRPVSTRNYDQSAPFRFDIAYYRKFLAQLGVDPNRFELSGTISNGRFVMQNENDGWAVWFEDNGRQLHKAWFSSCHDSVYYIKSMLIPRPWKEKGDGVWFPPPGSTPT